MICVLEYIIVVLSVIIVSENWVEIIYRVTMSFAQVETTIACGLEH